MVPLRTTLFFTGLPEIWQTLAKFYHPETLKKPVEYLILHPNIISMNRIWWTGGLSWDDDGAGQETSTQTVCITVPTRHEV